jgi:membrane protein implicated in regulation of membrane protease activity
MGGLYFATVVAAMLVGMRYLQTDVNTRHRIWLHAAGASAIILFISLIVGGLVVGSWWLPVAAVAVGALAQAVFEEYCVKTTLRADLGEVVPFPLHRLRQRRQRGQDRKGQDISALPPTAQQELQKMRD